MTLGVRKKDKAREWEEIRNTACGRTRMKAKQDNFDSCTFFGRVEVHVLLELVRAEDTSHSKVVGICVGCYDIPQ